MRTKTYFVEFLFSVVVIVCLLILVGVLFKSTQKETGEKQFTSQESLIVRDFSENYFNYSSENYKDRLPAIKELVSDSLYRSFEKAFDDMFIEKGYTATLNSYNLYQSEDDESIAFLTANVTYKIGETEQQDFQTAVITFSTKNKKRIISEFRFVQGMGQ